MPKYKLQEMPDVRQTGESESIPSWMRIGC